MAEQYYLIKRKIDGLVLQIDLDNVYGTNFRDISQPLWVIATQQDAQKDHQQWTITPEGYIKIKVNGWVLDIGQEDILPAIIKALKVKLQNPKTEEERQQILSRLRDLEWLVTMQAQYAQWLGFDLTQPLYRATVVKPPDSSNLNQKWSVEGPFIKSKVDERVLELFGSEDYSPVTTAKLSENPCNQEWELVPVNISPPPSQPQSAPQSVNETAHVFRVWNVSGTEFGQACFIYLVLAEGLDIHYNYGTVARYTANQIFNFWYYVSLWWLSWIKAMSLR